MDNGTAPTTATHPEVCFNLWAFADQDTHIIQRISAKAYALPGDYFERRAILKHLAATDFYSVGWSPVPENMTVTFPSGEALRGAVMLAQLDCVNEIFGRLLDEIQEMPEQLRCVGGVYSRFRLRTPQEPQFLLTVVIEREDGRLEPLAQD